MNNPVTRNEIDQTLLLLSALIETPSSSTYEQAAAGVLVNYLKSNGVNVFTNGNNVWAKNKFFNPHLPTLLLNSHIDTVPPNPQYSRNPYLPSQEGLKLFGLGSNDAGGSLACLVSCFIHFYSQPDLSFNLVLAATTEEEISGSGGIESLLPLLDPVDMAIVGEPTLMQMATSERGLMVVDCTVHGKPGHAAREEGDNALIKALPALTWFAGYSFPVKPQSIGHVKMTPTMINAGQSHNTVPGECHFTVDIRVPPGYSHEEILAVIHQSVQATIAPRSMRLRSSSIHRDHPLVRAGLDRGIPSYDSPTTSDMALMAFPALKMGPGDSARSHMADEYIYVSEVADGLMGYIQHLDRLNKIYENLGKRT